jgi:hypothetical protein
MENKNSNSKKKVVNKQKYSPNKNKKPFNKKPFDNNQKPFNQRVNIFAENQKKKIVNSFENIIKQINSKHPTMSDNYRKFVNKVNNPTNRRIVKMLPIVLLSLTVLAIKNKRLIKPLIEAYQVVIQTSNASETVGKKVIMIVKEYCKYFSTLGSSIETLDITMSTLSLFLEDIPQVFERLDINHGISQLTIQKNIFRNAADIKREFLDRPEREKYERDLKEENRKFIENNRRFQEEQREIDKKLREDMKSFLIRIEKEDYNLN